MPRVFEEKQVTLQNGNKAHYLEWPGSGPTLVLLHPSVGYARIWEWFVDALGGDYHIFAPDQRGHGRSDKPDGDYSAQEGAEDVNLFMQAVGIDRAVVIGHSLGGRVGQVFAARYPKAARGLVIVAGPHLSNFHQPRSVAVNVIETARETIHYPDEFASAQEAHAFLRARKPWDHEPDAALDHRVEHNFEHLPDGRLIPRYDKIRVAQGLSHMADNLRPYAARVECPVLLLRAANGNTPREDVDKLATLWRDARVEDVDGIYTLQMENPQGVAQAVSAFVSGLSG